MKFRKLRIAWSVFWGAACVLLICFWVRSYTWSDGWSGSLSGCFIEGECNRSDVRIAAYWSSDHTRWQFDSMEMTPAQLPEPFYFAYDYGNYGAVLWTWLGFPVAGSVAFAAAPWLRWRFGLRTLLIATTLVVVVLGLAVLAASK
jgi:hypothetical protein